MKHETISPASHSAPLDAPRTAHPRVLFITRKWAPALGGMETYCVKLVERLAIHTRIDVMALAGRKDRRPPHWLALALFPLTVLRRWFLLKTKPEIVHLGDLAIWPIALFTRVFVGKAHCVISAHGTDASFASRKSLAGRSYAAYQRLGAAMLPRVHVIANSQATAEACRAIGWQRISTVALASDLPSPGASEYGPTTILFAGRLIRQKGLSWFVREVLPKLDPSLRLEVAGLPLDRSEVRALDNPRVHFLGPLSRDELAQRYTGSLAVIAPNIDLGDGSFEGFGLVAPEAAIAGGLVLGANIGGLRDAIIDETTGFLIASGDPQAWAEKISEIAAWSKEKRAQFIMRSQSVASEHFSWDRVAAQTIGVYAGLCGE